MKAVIKASELLLSGDIDGGDYRIVKSDCENKISVLEQKLFSLGDTRRTLDAIVNKAVDILSHPATLYENASSLKKKGNHKFDLPGKLVFEGFII